MTDQKELPIYQKDGRYFKDKICSVNYADQDTASILWQLKRSLEQSRAAEGPRDSTRRISVKLLLLLLLICALGMVVVSVVYWWPDLIHRFTNPAPLPTSAMNPAQAQQSMSDELKNYSDRVSDLEKLISVLLGLSAIYTISLGLSSWASVQSNLQQAEKWIQVQQSITKDLKDQAEKSVEKLESLLLRHEAGLASIQDAIIYARTIQSASASLALAVQGKFVSDAELAVKDLVELRAKLPTDRVVNLYLGRMYKVLGRLKNAVDAMTVFIKNKESAQQIHDVGAGDAYYNRACYRSLLWSRGTNAERLALQAEIVKDINEFCSIDETLKTGISQDTDFDAVRTEEWFTDALK
jgi:hypothetical protein